MRISDWSSDVCSSDLGNGRRPGRARDAMSMAAPFPGTMPAPGGCASAAERIHSAAMDIPGADDETLMQAYGAGNLARSDERRVGKEWVSTFRSRWAQSH